jgi:hypothetical protein
LYVTLLEREFGSGSFLLLVALRWLPDLLRCYTVEVSMSFHIEMSPIQTINLFFCKLSARFRVDLLPKSTQIWIPNVCSNFILYLW